MSISSHNTMTYLTPKKWWMKIFSFVAKCQDKTLQEQYDLGVRTFDIRVTYVDGILHFAHGLIVYDSMPIYNYFNIINQFPEKCTVRLILESKYYLNKIKFKKDFTNYIIYFNNIKFVEGVCKYGWEKLLNIPPFEGIQLTSSTTGSIIDDWFPRLYAMFKNKKIVKQYKNSDTCVLIDFIGKYY